MPVGIVSTIVFCNVLLLMVMTKIVFGSRYTIREVLAVVAAIIGVALILDVFKFGPGTLSVAGIWWAVPPMIGYAIIFTFDKYYIVNGAKVEVILFYCNLFASVVLWLNTPPWKIAGDLLAASAAHGYLFWAVVAGFVLVPIIISFALFLKSYELIEPIFVSVTQTFDPVTATFLGLLLFNQKLGIMQISGIAIVLAALGYFQYIDAKLDKMPA
jgi:drug/metabolite transporter (DMT)-like permease